MKAGVRPREEDISWDSKMLGIPKLYWIQILEEMVDNGLIRGFWFQKTKDGIIVNVSDDAGITISGQQYLKDNSHMREVKSFLGESFQTVLSAMVQALVTASTF